MKQQADERIQTDDEARQDLASCVAGFRRWLTRTLALTIENAVAGCTSQITQTRMRLTLVGRPERLDDIVDFGARRPPQPVPPGLF